MSYLPLFLNADLCGPILIVGGGGIAASKAEALLSVGAGIDVVADRIADPFKNFCTENGFSYCERPYTAEDLEGRRVVIAATDDDRVNTQIASDCRARGILVNVVDNPPLCDFIFPALVRRGPLQIAISSSGISPVLARLVKQMIERMIPSAFERVISFLDDKKSDIRAGLTQLQPRRLFYDALINGPVIQDVLEGNNRKADHLFRRALEDFPNENRAALYLVGAGPGHPDLITIKGVQLLGQADVILYDRLVSLSLLDQYARKDALKIAVGKTRDHHLKKQDEIDALIEHHLKKGRNVVRLKGGDPGIYAHGAEEIAAAKRAGAPYQIVPGISAANGCAAYAGIPLTERGGALSVRFLTLYKDQLDQEDFWEGLGQAQDETLVFYMSTSHYGLLCRKLVRAGFSPETPFVIIEQGTTPYHREYSGTLGIFDAAYGTHSFGSPCLMIVGDVVKWREAHQWKDSPEESGQYFMTLKEAAHA